MSKSTNVIFFTFLLFAKVFAMRTIVIHRHTDTETEKPLAIGESDLQICLINVQHSRKN